MRGCPKPSAATAIATLALFVALGGVGLAASHYVITSVGQIKPSVRHELRGKRGPRGPRGLPGKSGKAGAPGTIDWAQAYLLDNLHNTEIDAKTPGADLLGACRKGDHVIVGGFNSNHAIVTTSALTQNDTADGQWEVIAHLEPGQSDGWVAVWVLCSES